jgi:methyl-accepting chemotaxis protein
MAQDTTINSGCDQGSLVCESKGETSHLPLRPNLKKKSLRKRLLAAFCALALVAVVVNLNFVLHWDAKQTRAYIINCFKQVAGAEANPGSAVPTTFRNHLLLVLAITAVCFATIIYLFYKRLLAPLDAIAESGIEISNGNLDVSAPSNSLDEIGELGQVVNQIAANYQEVLLFTGTTAGNSHSAVEKIEGLLNRQQPSENVNELQEQVDIVKRDLETLEEMVKEFRFFETYFDGRKVVRHGPEGE